MTMQHKYNLLSERHLKTSHVKVLKRLFCLRIFIDSDFKTAKKSEIPIRNNIFSRGRGHFIHTFSVARIIFSFGKNAQGLALSWKTWLLKEAVTPLTNYGSFHILPSPFKRLPFYSNRAIDTSTWNRTVYRNSFTMNEWSVGKTVVKLLCVFKPI